ncbi:MAG TPA: Mur ligase family protein, partial [Acidimicrobiales bacterium]|nr:Mur ligase family protein [Acidimicrobiales bacterium]
MRHALSFSDLAGARVGVLGLGVEGRAARDRLRALGCDLVLVDDHPEAVGDAEVRANDDLARAALRSCAAVVKSPGVSRYRDDVASLEASGIPVLGGVGMWLEEADRDRVVCVTGTKGKSTVTTVIGHLAQRLGTPSAVVGNLGLPPFAPGVELEDRLVVVETSSFQATDVAHSPGVVVVTALGDDHLDWHRSAAAYHADKLSLTSQPGARRTIVADTPLLREHEELVGGEPIWVGEGDARLASALGLAGAHGARN